MSDITRELLHLYPGAEWTCADGVVVFNDGRTPPSDEEIAAATVEIAAADAASKYQVDRRPEYPPIGDQLDALFHHGAFPDDMAALIQAVKDKYPKPE